MRKVTLSTVEKYQLLERFNVLNVKTIGDTRFIYIKCICESYHNCTGCPFAFEVHKHGHAATRLDIGGLMSLFSQNHGCIAFMTTVFDYWTTPFLTKRTIRWSRSEDETALRFFAKVRKWLHSPYHDK